MTAPVAEIEVLRDNLINVTAQLSILCQHEAHFSQLHGQMMNLLNATNALIVERSGKNESLPTITI